MGRVEVFPALALCAGVGLALRLVGWLYDVAPVGRRAVPLPPFQTTATPRRAAELPFAVASGEQCAVVVALQQVRSNVGRACVCVASLRGTLC